MICRFRKSLGRCSAFALFTLSLAACATAAKPEPWIDDGTAARIDAVFAAFARPDSPGYAIGLVRHGNLVFARGYGAANIEDHVSIDRHTAFHLASLSKQFTAAAIVLLVRDKKLSLDDPVGRYIPEARKFGSHLRVKHLAYMTSGLHEYLSVPRKNGSPWFTSYYFTRDEAIAAALAPAALRFAPGTRYEYSNVNFMILTRIVEKVAGMPFSRFMRTRVFQPLGMADTEINDDSTQIIPHRAIGYAPRDGRVVRELASVGVFARSGPGWVRLDRNSPHFGGSGVFSTLDDLAKWDADWYSGRLAGRTFAEAMNRRLEFRFGTMDGMGLAFRVAYGHPSIDYSGADVDASTFMERFPAEGLTIVCLSNDPLGDCEGRSNEVLSILHDSHRL